MTQKPNDRLLFILGIAICFAVAALSVLLEKLIPGGLLGASIIALFMGTIINSIGIIPTAVSGVMKSASKFLMVTALAAVGLGTSITDFRKAGLRPMFYGITIDTLVTLTALVVIWCMGLL